jgi:NAD-dependent deacetylase
MTTALKRIVALTGAGISAESGLKTFRDSGGLWEGYRVEEVATPEAWRANRAKVLQFYNERRKAAREAKPNRAHEILAELQNHFRVTVITQNVDNLHERAGSQHIIHLHGSLFEARSTADPSLIYPIEGWQLNEGDKCEKGSQLRPNIVWFGEPVPAMEEAAAFAAEAEIFLVVGTSLQVYPAAGLIQYAPRFAPKFIVDPGQPEVGTCNNLRFIAKRATEGMEDLKKILLNDIL